MAAGETETTGELPVSMPARNQRLDWSLVAKIVPIVGAIVGLTYFVHVYFASDSSLKDRACRLQIQINYLMILEEIRENVALKETFPIDTKKGMKQRSDYQKKIDMLEYRKNDNEEKMMIRSQITRKACEG